LNKFIIDKNNKNRLSSFFEESGKKKISEIPEPKIEDDFFITACLDLKVYIWNTKRSKDPFYIIYVNEIITKALFFPDGSKLCLGSIKGNIFIYNVKDNFSYSYSFHVRNKNKKGSMKKKITDIKFIKKNEILVTTNDSRIRIININDGSVIQKFKGHKNMEGMLKCDFCENYEIIISPSEDKYVYLWNIEKKKKLDVMNDLVININNATNKEQKLSNKKVYNYEYFKPKYSERKEYCTQCLFLEGQNLINYNHKIYNNELLIYIKNIIILTTNKGNIQVLLNFNALEDK
jgi:WD40 repeat protein